MVKWIAYFDYNHKLQCDEIEVKETTKQYHVTGRATLATDFLTRLDKDALSDTKEAALAKLRERIVSDLERAEAEVNRIRVKLNRVLEGLP